MFPFIGPEMVAALMRPSKELEELTSWGRWVGLHHFGLVGTDVRNSVTSSHQGGNCNTRGLDGSVEGQH